MAKGANMREIKFRARDLVLDKYVPWERLLEGDTFRSVLFDKNYAIEQFTGLKDKHGTEIYEGDIVILSGITSYSNGKNIKIYGVVKYNTGSAQFCVTDTHAWYTADEIEVIGTIHEEREK